MNKSRVNKLEAKAQGILQRDLNFPYVWRPEEGKIAIVDTPWMLARLTQLGREIVRSPYFFTAVYVDKHDSEIIERIEGRLLYLKGIKEPLHGLPELFEEEPGHNE